MRKATAAGIISLSAMLLATAFFLLMGDGDRNKTGDSSTVGAHSAPQSPEVHSADGKGSRKAEPQAISRASVGHEIKGDYSIYAPNTTDELKWLKKNSFPSDEEMRAGASGRAQAGEFSISDGYTAFEILRAENYGIANVQDRERAVDFLGRAAADGSIYALEALGNVYSIGAGKNVVQSEAYYRAAIIRGNWSAILRARPGISRQDEILADLMAQQIILNLNRARAGRGLPPLGYDPRPGLDEFSKSISDAISRKRFGHVERAY